MDDVHKINMHFKSLKMDSKADFEVYYNNLPEDLKSQLSIHGNKELLSEGLSEFLNFFYKCEESNAGIFIECY